MKLQKAKILLVPKMTKVEWDMRRLQLTEEQLETWYKREGLDYLKIYASHREQKENLTKIQKIFSDITLIERDALTKERAAQYDLVIAFGGDNHFQFVAHFLDDTPILGVNSDPLRSEGALTSVQVEELEKIFKGTIEKEIVIEKWPRLVVTIDRKPVEILAIADIFIGEEKRHSMSRHHITINNQSEEQKGSGLLIATGAGSGGWYTSASRYLFPEGGIFSKTMQEARFILTEPYRGRLSNYNLIQGVLQEGKTLEVTTLSDSSPILAVDSLELIKLREGAVIRITLGKSLKVVKLL